MRIEKCGREASINRHSGASTYRKGQEEAIYYRWSRLAPLGTLLCLSRAAAAYDYLNAQQAQGLPVTSAETAIELTYLAQITSWFALQPDLQHVIAPNTTPTIPNAWALQVRFEISF